MTFLTFVATIILSPFLILGGFYSGILIVGPIGEYAGLNVDYSSGNPSDTLIALVVAFWLFIIVGFLLIKRVFQKSYPLQIGSVIQNVENEILEIQDTKPCIDNPVIPETSEFYYSSTIAILYILFGYLLVLMGGVGFIRDDISGIKHYLFAGVFLALGIYIGYLGVRRLLCKNSVIRLDKNGIHLLESNTTYSWENIEGEYFDKNSSPRKKYYARGIRFYNLQTQKSEYIDVQLYNIGKLEFQALFAVYRARSIKPIYTFPLKKNKVVGPYSLYYPDSTLAGTLVENYKNAKDKQETIFYIFKKIVKFLFQR